MSEEDADVLITEFLTIPYFDLFFIQLSSQHEFSKSSTSNDYICNIYFNEISQLENFR